jgi:hypothetical protein
MAYSILEQLESEPKLMDVKRLAVILCVGPKMIYQLVENGRIPCLHVGSLLKFDPQTTAHWVRKQSPYFALAARDALKNKE